MITYDVYNVTYVDKKPKKSLSNEEVYTFVARCGAWDLTECYSDKVVAWHMWNNKWADMATTEIDEYDNDFVRYSVYVFERSNRDDETEEVEDSDLLSYSAEEI